MNKIKQIQYWLITLAGLLGVMLLDGCSTVDEHIVTPDPATQTVQFTVDIPDVRTLSTRSMAGYREDEVTRVDLLLFNATDPANELYKGHVAATGGIRQTESGITFSAALPPTNTKTRIAVVANANIADIVKKFQSDVTTKLEVMKALTHVVNNNSSSDWKWHTDNGDYTPIPMYGEAVVSEITPQMGNITGIELTRMLARIDVINSSTDFIVDDIYLVNYNTIGYIATAWDKTTGQILDTTPDNPLIPSPSGKKFGAANALHYAVNGATKYEGEIYAYESPAASDDAGREDATCLVIKGRKGDGGTPYYYRVDFTIDGPGSSWIPYIALKRNYKYIIDILEVSDAPGYTKLVDAVSSYTVMSNLKTRMIYFSRSLIKEVVFNGQHMLGLQNTQFNFGKATSKATVSVFTDSPGGWTAYISADWLYFEGGTVSDKLTKGVANNDGSFTFAIKNYNLGTETRSADITVTAGRLSQKVTVTQTPSDEGLMLSITDEAGNPIDKLLFYYSDYDTKVTPQRVFVSWRGGANLQAKRSENNPLLTYNIIDPYINEGSAQYMTTLFGQMVALTIQPNIGPYTAESWNTVYWDYIYFALFDSSWMTLLNKGLSLEMRRIALEATNIDQNGYLAGGSTHSFSIRSGVPWVIKSIEEVNAVSGTLLPSGSLLAAGGGNLAVNKTGGPSGTGVQTDALSFTTGKWVYGQNGIVRITFASTKDAPSQFTQVVEFNVHSTAADYTDNGLPYYFLFKRRFQEIDGNPIRYSTAAAGQTKCVQTFGTGWRLPSMNELLTAYVYRQALGGISGISGDYGWLWEHHWANSYINTNQYFSIDMGSGYTKWASSGSGNARCVYTNPETPRKYPYVLSDANGPIIVSRDASGGVSATALLSGTTAPIAVHTEQDMSNNLVAPKLQVANADENPLSTYYTWSGAVNQCAAKGGGWRLPTQREALLIMAMGGTTSAKPISGNAPLGSWPASASYKKMNSANYVYWLSTSDFNTVGTATPKAWVIDVETGYTNVGYKTNKGENDGTFYGGARCVRSVN